MQGEDVSETNNKDELETIDPNRSYKNISNFKKQIILFAGPGMNLILPFLLLPLIYMNGIDIPSFLKDKPIVGYVKKDPKGQFFLKGDRILEINGTKIENWEELGKSKSDNLTSEQVVRIERNGKIVDIVLKNSNNDKVFLLDNIYPNHKPVIDQILTKSIADDIDLRKYDKILKINNVTIESWYQISEVLRASNDASFTITIEREKSIIIKRIAFKGKERMLGITPMIELTSSDFTFIDSIKRGFNDSLRMIKLIFNGIIGLFSSLFSSDSSLSELKSSLAGPISIAKYSGLAAEKGFNSIIQFVVVVSINLGVINLLPIPLLDGGHILFNTIEIITRRKINIKVQNFINKIGFAILITLMLFAIYNDIINF
jgi:regulator of sigma E protease